MGPISSIIYSAGVKFTEGKNGAGSHKRLQLGNIAESIAFKTEREMKFFNKHHYIPLQAKDDKGKLVKVYVNVNSLAQKTGLTKTQIREENKQGHLEALVQSKGAGTDHAIERRQQVAAQGKLQTKLQELKGIDPGLSQRTLDKMVGMLIKLENREENGKPYLEHLEDNFQKYGEPTSISKGKSDFPYSFEYHGKNENGESILLLKYDPNFAKGAFKKTTKALDFYSARVLVKSKIVEFDKADREIQGYRNMEGIKGALNLVLVMRYNKNGSQKAAIYTDFKNVGDLVKRKKSFFGRVEAQLAEIPKENQKRVLLLGMYRMLETLEQIHEKGIVHRDVKPGNIFLHNKNGHYQFFLGDAGLSSHKNNANDYGIGTIFAPEQLNYDGVNRPNEKVDIYALSKTFQGIFKHQAAQKGNNPEDWNDSRLNDLFQAMQARSVEDRHSATQAKSALRQILLINGIDPSIN